MGDGQELALVRHGRQAGAVIGEGCNWQTPSLVRDKKEPSIVRDGKGIQIIQLDLGKLQT